jgi:hypothetical protein
MTANALAILFFFFSEHAYMAQQPNLVFDSLFYLGRY